MANRGSTAPRVNASAEAPAACHGLVSSSGSMDSSASRWAASASCSVSSRATVRAVSGRRPFASYSAASSASSISGSSRSSRFSVASWASSESRWLDTDTYSPRAIDTAPATRPAMPAVNSGPRSVVTPATPTTSPATDTMPSLAPSTPARNQFSRDPKPAPCCSPGWWRASSGRSAFTPSLEHGRQFAEPYGARKWVVFPCRAGATRSSVMEQWTRRQWEAVIAVMWGYGAGWGWGAWLAMGVSMVVLWGLVVAGGIVLVRTLAGGRNQHPSATRDALSEAERMLADRFVRGEIDEDEFRRRSAVLHSGR